MNKQKAEQWAELYTALAEGKNIQVLDPRGRWEDVDVDNDYCDYLVGLPSDYRIKPQFKTRRMTNQKFADWLRDCPEEHREYKYRHDILVSYQYDYDEDEANEEVGDVLIRRNHGEWEEPIIEVEES